MKIKRGDQVVMKAGKDRGKQGKVLHAYPSIEKVVVEGLNQIKKNRRPKRQGEKGQIVDIPAAVDVSNVQLICQACSKPTRVGVRMEKGQKERVCKKCNAVT